MVIHPMPQGRGLLGMWLAPGKSVIYDHALYPYSCFPQCFPFDWYLLVYYPDNILNSLQPTPSASLSRGLHWVGCILWMSSMDGYLHWMSSVLASVLCNPTVRVIWKSSWQITWPTPRLRVGPPDLCAISERCWANLLKWETFRSPVPSPCVLLPTGRFSWTEPKSALSSLWWMKQNFLSSTFYLPFIHLVCLNSASLSFKVFSYLN